MRRRGDDADCEDDENFTEIEDYLVISKPSKYLCLAISLVLLLYCFACRLVQMYRKHKRYKDKKCSLQIVSF